MGAACRRRGGAGNLIAPNPWGGATRAQRGRVRFQVPPQPTAGRSGPMGRAADRPWCPRRHRRSGTPHSPVASRPRRAPMPELGEPGCGTVAPASPAARRRRMNGPAAGAEPGLPRGGALAGVGLPVEVEAVGRSRGPRPVGCRRRQPLLGVLATPGRPLPPGGGGPRSSSPSRRGPGPSAHPSPLIWTHRCHALAAPVLHPLARGVPAPRAMRTAHRMAARRPAAAGVGWRPATAAGSDRRHHQGGLLREQRPGRGCCGYTSGWLPATGAAAPAPAIASRRSSWYNRSGCGRARVGF